MKRTYEINELAKEESWRMFRIMGEFVDGFDALSRVQPAVTIYGSARIKPHHPLYAQAQEIGRGLAKAGFSVFTGGGPGVMAAANQGAREVGGNSIGLSIKLNSLEEAPNPFTTLTLSFRYFFVRKVMLVRYATAFVLMPGGLGTMDEFFETLTLIQTGKIKPFPVILFGSEYWKGLLGWMHEAIIGKGFLTQGGLKRLYITDDPTEAVSLAERLCRGGRRRAPLAKRLAEEAQL
ncbi:MAG: TIGR00730 family Rossman fold protein [Dehalococcoidia bacterium]